MNFDEYSIDLRLPEAFSALDVFSSLCCCGQIVTPLRAADFTFPPAYNIISGLPTWVWNWVRKVCRKQSRNVTFINNANWLFKVNLFACSPRLVWDIIKLIVDSYCSKWQTYIGESRHTHRFPLQVAGNILRQDGRMDWSRKQIP